MKERIIVTLTTWSKRINNIPAVLDTIYAQSIRPDFVVLNLSIDEVIPAEVQQYIDSHSIEINKVPDTKVYKKLIPTLKKYPNDCIISIDDDWLYPKEMIADFVDIHKRHPNNPVSGNRVCLFGFQCHCGCASLTKAEHFGRFIYEVDEDMMSHCPSDDLVYTFLANMAGHPYMRTSSLYFTNMAPYNEKDSYSQMVCTDNALKRTWAFLENKYGMLRPNIDKYIGDKYMSSLVEDIICKSISQERSASNYYEKSLHDVLNSNAYKLGTSLIKPIRWIKALLCR